MVILSNEKYMHSFAGDRKMAFTTSHRDRNVAFLINHRKSYDI